MFNFAFVTYKTQISHEVAPFLPAPSASYYQHYTQGDESDAPIHTIT
jgi:hypothetical protein